MEWADAIKILFGAGLGFLISWLQVGLASRRQRLRAEKLLLIELPTIDKFVAALAGKELMPTTTLPNLRYFGLNEMVSLHDSVASQVYQLESALKDAEVSRKIASGYLNNQSSPEFQIHSMLYTSCMDSALIAIRVINEKLK